MDEFFDAPPFSDEAVKPDPVPEKPATGRPRARKVDASTGAFFKYRAPDGKAWRCDVPDKLFTDFGITGMPIHDGTNLRGCMATWGRCAKAGR